MANNTFSFVGKIIPCKETDSFKPYQEVWFKNSEWGKKQIRFNMVCGTNRHMLDVSALINKNQDDSTIYTYTMGVNGRSEQFNVPFKNRFKPDIIEKVVSWRKYVIDLNPPYRKERLEAIIKKFESGTVTDKEMNEVNVNDINEAKSALNEAIELRKEFISEIDFVDALNQLVNNPEIADIKFKVIGDYELEYNERDDKWYRKFKPNKIFTTNDDVSSAGTLHIVFNKNSIDDNEEKTLKKIHINGHTPVYLSNYKKTFMCPISITINGNGDENNEKRMLGFKKLFTTKDGYKELGVNVEFLDGAQVVELTEDMLTDEQKENLEYGLITMEDIKRELGKPVYGDRIVDIVAVKPANGYSKGAKETVYSSADFGKPSVNTNASIKNKVSDIKSDDIDDLFADDEI